MTILEVLGAAVWEALEACMRESWELSEKEASVTGAGALVAWEVAAWESEAASVWAA